MLQLIVLVLFVEISAHIIEAPSENLAKRNIECVIPAINCQTLDSQWNLWNTGQIGDYPGVDLRVVRVWAQGYMGCGITVKVIDDGINYCHPDLRNNFDPQLSFNLVDNISDVFSTGNHGTSIASIIAGDRSSKCTIGIAPEAKIASAKINTSHINDREVSQALSDDSGTVDIYCSSWGPTGVDGPGALTMAALERGISMGRDRKGSIFSFPAGNGGPDSDCSWNGFVNSLWTIGLGSLQVNGDATPTDTPCSAKMASVYNSDSMGRNALMANNGETCEQTFGDSSGSNAEACAIFALALQANPSLTWLDMQYLVVLTSDPTGLAGNMTKNGAGLSFSRQYGFGALDSEAIVSRARTWKNVDVNEHIIHTSTPMEQTGSTPFSVITRYTEDIVYVLKVTAVITVDVPQNNEGIGRGDLRIDLTSPMGTTSALLQTLTEDKAPGNYEKWNFTSAHLWGEDPRGDWILNITLGNSTIGDISSIQLIYFGAIRTPEAVTESKNCDRQCVRGCAREGALYCDSCRELRNATTLECISTCPTPYVGRNGYCIDLNMNRQECRSQKQGSLARCGDTISAKNSLWLMLAASAAASYLLYTSS